MNGTVEVVDDGSERATPAEVRAEAAEAIADAREDAEGFEEPELEEDGDEVTVAAGWGDKITSINRFGPAEIEVEEGTTVNWAIDNPYEPHTVTFDAPFDDLTDPRAFAPGGVLDGEDYTGGFANSGFIGKLAPYDSFSLRFTETGTYEYVCVLHPGMDGVVKVT
jgi:plastocyanin